METLLQNLIFFFPPLWPKVLDELQAFSEGWAGISLTPAIAYGFRLYQNNSILNMHVDKPQTHVISMIYHIDSESLEPWPIFIEGKIVQILVALPLSEVADF